jgi:hypothetical protein
VQTSLKYPVLRFGKKKIMNFAVKRSIWGGEVSSWIIPGMRFLFGNDGAGTGRVGGLESLEDAIKRFMEEGYYIFNVGLLRLRACYAGVFDSG